MGRPINREDTVRALSVVLQHELPVAHEEFRAECARLARDLGHTQALYRTARVRYSTLRYNVWQIAHRAFANFQPHDTALEEVMAETLDSDDDRAWEEDGWVE